MHIVEKKDEKGVEKMDVRKFELSNGQSSGAYGSCSSHVAAHEFHALYAYNVNITL